MTMSMGPGDIYVKNEAGAWQYIGAVTGRPRIVTSDEDWAALFDEVVFADTLHPILLSRFYFHLLSQRCLRCQRPLRFDETTGTLRSCPHALRAIGLARNTSVWIRSIVKRIVVDDGGC